MNNLPEIKLGIVVGSTDWMPSDAAIEMRKKLIEIYISIYGENGIHECPICLTDNEINVKRALKDLEKNECNALCIYYANYGPESTGTLMASDFPGPVMMIAAAEEGDEPLVENRLDGMSGFINACYALKLRAVDVYIPESPIGTLEQCVGMIYKFKAISRALIAVRELKVISFGPRPSSYLASSAPNYLLYDLGIEISEYSELELFESFNKHDNDSRIEKVVEAMKNETDTMAFNDKLSEFARYELTVEDWIRSHKGKHKYVTVTSTCWPAFPNNFGFVPCYVNSRIAARGIPVACEADVYGAVSEFIGQAVSGETVTILNLNNNISEKIYKKKIEGKNFDGGSYKQSDLFIGYHCGVTSSEKLDSHKLEFHYVNKQLIGEENSKGTIQGHIKEGLITIFRLQGTRDGTLRAYVAEGEIIPVDLDTYGGYGIIGIKEFERFLRHVVIEKGFPNHCAVIFGHYGSELVGVMKSLGLNEIYFNQPENVYYEGENIYS